jgi:hypothetical protein
MFSTVPGTRLLASSTASQQTTDAEESAVNGVAAAIETYSTNNASHTFNYLAGQQ